MGHHFVNLGLMDLELDPVQPEILAYAPGPNGKLRLVAVEYAVPIAPWDALHDSSPTVLGQHLHANPHLGPPRVDLAEQPGRDVRGLEP